MPRQQSQEVSQQSVAASPATMFAVSPVALERSHSVSTDSVTATSGSDSEGTPTPNPDQQLKSFEQTNLMLLAALVQAVRDNNEIQAQRLKLEMVKLQLATGQLEAEQKAAQEAQEAADRRHAEAAQTMYL